MAATPRFRLSQAEASNCLRRMRTESADLAVLEPSQDRAGKGEAGAGAQGLPPGLDDILSELFRVLKPERHLYLFCLPETMFWAKPAAETPGFRFSGIVVWDRTPECDAGRGDRCRYILRFEKGRRGRGRNPIPGLIYEPPVRGDHHRDKPKAVAQALLLHSTAPGDLVVDPLMGSGWIGAAAMELGRDFWGNEPSAEAVEAALRRLRAAGGVLSGQVGGECAETQPAEQLSFPFAETR